MSRLLNCLRSRPSVDLVRPGRSTPSIPYQETLVSNSGRHGIGIYVALGRRYSKNVGGKQVWLVEHDHKSTTTVLADTPPILSTLVPPVFHHHVRRFHWISLPIVSCAQIPFRVWHDLGSVASRRIDLRNILECLFFLALSERTSRNRPSFSRH